MEVFLRSSRASWAMAALSLVLLAGCLGDERVAGGDDYPNSVEPLGRRAAEETRDSSEWNAHGEAPGSAPGVYDSTRVPESAPQSSAAKRGASQLLSLDVEIGFDLAGVERTVSRVTEPGGLLRAVRVQSATGFRAEDTVWYRPDSLGLPRLARVSGRVETPSGARYAVFEDGDGDGLLSPRGAGSVALARFVTVHPSGERETEQRTFRAGPDSDFNAHGDNGLWTLRRTVVMGLDTLLSLILSDADGDGLIYNPLRDSNQVDVVRRSRSGAVETSLAYRIAVFRDSARNYTHRYLRVVKSATGVDSVFALGPDSLPDFAPGDSGFTRVVFRSSSAADTLASSESWYAVALSPQGEAPGNKLLEVHRTKTYRLGDLSRFSYRLRPEAAVSAGGYARTGAVSARADFEDGNWITLEGEATTSEIVGMVLDSEGRDGLVRFDLAGRVKSAGGF